MSGWRKRTIMEMAQEAGFMAFEYPALIAKEDLEKVEVFAKLVREEAIAEANARANASWTLMCEKMVAAEREACAKLCDELANDENTDEYINAADWCAVRIRARGDKHD